MQRNPGGVWRGKGGLIHLATRTRSVFATAALVLLAGVVAADAPQTPPSRKLADYVLVASRSIALNNNAHVFSGLVGVDEGGAPAGAGPNDQGSFYLSHHGRFDPPAAPVADGVRLSNDTHVGDVFANRFTRATDTGFTGVQSFDFFAATHTLFESLPALPAFGCPTGGTPVTVARLGSDTLAAGTYGALVVKDWGQLTLPGGTYTFDSIRLGKHTVLILGAATTLDVCGNVRISNESTVQIPPGADATALHLNVGGTSFAFSHWDDFTGMVLAPRARVRLGGPTKIRGQIVALVINSDSRVDLVCDTGGAGCPPVPSTTTTTVPGGGTTTTLPGGGTTTTLPGGGTTTTLPHGSTTTTLPGGGTTTTLPGSGTTTTTAPSGPTTTTTLPGDTGTPEICGDCIDNDGNGLTDFEDPACCQQEQLFTMSVSRGRIRGHGGKTSLLRIKSLLAAAGLSDVDPYHQDVLVQIRPEGGKDIFCARIPASAFMRMHGNPKFWDRKHTVPSAQGIDDLTVVKKKDGSVRLRTLGKHANLAAPSSGRLQVTVGFRNMKLSQRDQTQNRCSTTIQGFRTRRGGLLAP